MSNEMTPPAKNPVPIVPGLTQDECILLSTPLPHDLSPVEAEATWARYQDVIGQFLIRIGMESKMLDNVARFALMTNIDGVYARLALIPKLGSSAKNVLEKHGISDLIYHIAGECTLMELSAAAGYRTFCLPELVKGLLKTGKMRDRSIERMMDTFEFLTTMVQRPYNDPAVLAQLERTNGMHARYKVAGFANQAAKDLFKYIALNMFYIGPSMRPDLSPQERQAICGLTVLVAKRMGHTIEGSVLDLERFIQVYEDAHMFQRNDRGILRQRAVEIAQASKAALYKIPTVSAARIHGYVPHRVKMLLQI